MTINAITDKKDAVISRPTIATDLYRLSRMTKSSSLVFKSETDVDPHLYPTRLAEEVGPHPESRVNGPLPELFKGQIRLPGVGVDLDWVAGVEQVEDVHENPWREAAKVERVVNTEVDLTRTLNSPGVLGELRPDAITGHGCAGERRPGALR